jgi:hypothetical protein
MQMVHLISRADRMRCNPDPVFQLTGWNFFEEIGTLPNVIMLLLVRGDDEPILMTSASMFCI